MYEILLKITSCHSLLEIFKNKGSILQILAVAVFC